MQIKRLALCNIDLRAGGAFHLRYEIVKFLTSPSGHFILIITFLIKL